MKTSTVLRSLITAAPYLRSNLLVRQDGNTCGDLMGAYSNVQAPICSGATSICTFDGRLQGCCDDQDQCQFYTKCVGSYSNEDCEGSFCLSCSSPAPYCLKFEFWDQYSLRGYDGYSCAEFQATQTIFGLATSILEVAVTSSSSSVATSSSTYSSSTEVPILTRFNSTESASSTVSISSNNSSSIINTSKVSSTMSSVTSSTATGTAAPESKPVSHKGAIAGGVIGGLALLALAILGCVCFKRRRSGGATRESVPYAGGRVGEVQQVYNDNGVPRPLRTRGNRYGA